MKKRFIDYYKETILRPTTAFSSLIEDNSKLKLGFYAVLITAIVYTFVYIFLIFGGGQPFKPWLNIPLETYYRYNLIFCAPSMFLGWILAAAVVHTTMRIFTDEGNFEQTLSTFGFGISIASWTTGIHDCLTSFFGAVHIISQHDYETALNSPTIWRTLLWIQMAAYLIWFIILFSKSVQVIYKQKTGLSILLGTLGFLVYQFFFFIFNR